MSTKTTARKAKAEASTADVKFGLFDSMKGFEAFKGFDPMKAFEGMKMDGFKGFGDDMNAYFGDATKAARENFVAMSNATLDMVQTNVNEGFDATRAVLEAKDVNEAAAIQTAYVKAVLARSNDEGKKLVDMATEAAKDAAEPMTAMVAKVRDQLKVA